MKTRADKGKIYHPPSLPNWESFRKLCRDSGETPEPRKKPLSHAYPKN